MVSHSPSVQLYVQWRSRHLLNRRHSNYIGTIASSIGGCRQSGNSKEHLVGFLAYNGERAKRPPHENGTDDTNELIDERVWQSSLPNRLVEELVGAVGDVAQRGNHHAVYGYIVGSY